MSLKIYNDFKIYNTNIIYADTLHYYPTPPYKNSCKRVVKS